MEFDRYYVVLLKKGPIWTPDVSPELETLQEKHLAHMSEMHEMGKLVLAGPVIDHSNAGDIRGIDIFPFTEFDSLDELKALVEADPAIKMGRLIADYMTWHVAAGATIKT